MKITRTITIDGENATEFQQIKDHLESLRLEYPNWELVQEPLLNRMTAFTVAHIDSLPQANT